MSPIWKTLKAVRNLNMSPFNAIIAIGNSKHFWLHSKHRWTNKTDCKLSAIIQV